MSTLIRVSEPIFSQILFRLVFCFFPRQTGYDTGIIRYNKSQHAQEALQVSSRDLTSFSRKAKVRHENKKMGSSECICTRGAEGGTKEKKGKKMATCIEKSQNCKNLRNFDMHV